jgi:ERCC4-type nuclease
LTDRELDNVLRDMTIIVDTREQKNDHLLKYFNDNGVKWVCKKLDTADYSFELPNHKHLGFDRKFLVEKKNSLSEITGNFTSGRERFQREFERVEDEHLHLVIENATWKKVVNGSYRSKMHPNSLIASLLSWSIRYDFKVWFVGKDESPMLIYNILRYELVEALKGVK